MANDRFVNNNLSELEDANRSPIFGYEDSPLLTLEEAAEKIIPPIDRLMDYIATAKKKYNRHSTLLTRDESAAIYLYSMPTPFFTRLNDTLRAENRHELKPWFAFLKLFITALENLPSTRKTVWRGVSGDFSSIFADGDLHIWWSVNSCSMDLKVVERYLANTGTVFAIDAVDAKDISAFSTFPEEQEIILMPGTRLRAKCQSLNFESRFFLVHLEEEKPQNKSQSESNYLFQYIRQIYQRNNRIERIMNPAKSFPIEQSYTNLLIVEAKEQREKEKQLRDAQHDHVIMSTFEKIYGSKTSVHVKDIFQTCKNQEKQVLIFGRAGIGKSTFCRHVAYQWATGSYWSQYELLALIPLRHLTFNRYPPSKEHSLIDLVEKEVFQYDLTEKDEILLKKHFDTKKTIWILDGYDEIVQNVPPHLEYLFEQLLKTPHHILTSRPYLNTLSYDVQMEITGFTDENIEKYVEQFFNQMKDELDDALIKSQTLLNFLSSNSRIWGVAHIPVNLELICSTWSNEDWSEIEQVTMTTLYSIMTEWSCRRYLTTSNKQIPNLSKDEVEQRCEKELSFLEILAFNAMESNTIIIRPHLLKKILNEAKVSSRDHPHVLNIGILKSCNKQGTGIRIEMSKDHYFIHLSFQEYFAARYLINALKGCQAEKAIEFIKYQKYNQRYALVFAFAAGLLSETDGKPCVNIFWDNILGEPSDLVGIRHIQLVISCIEETFGKSTLLRRTELLVWIAECIEHNFSTGDKNICKHLSQWLTRTQSVACYHTITNVFINLLQCNDIDTKIEVLSILSQLKISNPSITLIASVITRMGDENEKVRWKASEALQEMCGKAAINEVISKLMSALGDKSEYVRETACITLGKIGRKAATNEVISKLVRALRDESRYVSGNACKVLRKIGETIATNEVISKLVNALGDASGYARRNACYVLGEMGTKAATDEVISKLVSALGDKSEYVRGSACEALGKMSKKAATNEVISKLLSALGDESAVVRWHACEAFGKMGDKAATNEVITKLVSALGDESEYDKWNACIALGNMGEKAATNDVISKLASALGDESAVVRWYACEALGKMGEKATTSEAISRLVSTLGDKSEYVRGSVFIALGKIGEKAATNEVINKLVSVLGDEREDVRANAWIALGNMSEKVVPHEVINKLVSALGDKSEYVRGSAFIALGKIGEKAVTSEVISKLLSALGDESEYIRGSAFEALGKIGEKAVTNEMITKVVSALGDESKLVRENAWIILGKMGGKAITNEVISKVVSALGDENEDVGNNALIALGKTGVKAASSEVTGKLASAIGDENEDVRRNACYVLGQIGEEAATNEVISKLVSAVGDESEDVRMNACYALGKMCKKEATNEVISKLVSALGDENEYVRGSACKAVAKMGKKAATNEVISKLVSALGDKSDYVRGSACEAVGQMGEKAATDEVISKLVSAYGNESEYVRANAYKALMKMGEKAATNEVISMLLSVLGDERNHFRRDACKALMKMGKKAATNEVISKLVGIVNAEFDESYSAAEAVGNILISSAMITRLDPNIVADLCLCKRASDCLKHVSEEEIIKFFFNAQNPHWVSAVTKITLLKGAAVTATEDKVVVHGTKGPVELSVPNLELSRQLIEAFTDQRKRLHLYSEMK